MAHVTFHYIVQAIDDQLESLGELVDPRAQELAKFLTGLKGMLLTMCNEDRPADSYVNEFGDVGDRSS